MTENDILNKFGHNKRTRNSENGFKKCTVLELIEIKDYLQDMFVLKSGTYSTKKFYHFLENKKIHKYTFLRHFKAFIEIYSKRKRNLKGLESLIKKIELVENVSHYSYNRIELIQGTQENLFLRDLQLLRKNYLKISDQLFLNFAYENFKLNISKNTLRKKFYETNKFDPEIISI